MTPLPPTSTTQQDLDVIERFGKVIGSLAILTGTGAGIAKWMRARRARKEQRYAERIERIVRSAFASEIRDVQTAVASIKRIDGNIVDNTRSIADIQKETVRITASGDEIAGLMMDAVRENREWLDDLQSLVDHSFNIDRRSSIGSDRRQRLNERLDAIEARRAEQRRAADRVRDDFDETRDRLKDIADRNEVT